MVTCIDAPLYFDTVLLIKHDGEMLPPQPRNDSVFISDTTVLINGISGFDKTAFRIYPNPTNGRLRVESKFPMKAITVVDIYGRELESIYTQSATASDVVIEKLPVGVYFLKITDSADREGIRKVIRYD